MTKNTPSDARKAMQTRKLPNNQNAFHLSFS